jgi:hypothetical protein
LNSEQQPSAGPAEASTITVHVVGPPQLGGLYQECSRCGHVLQDYTGQEVMVAVEPGEAKPPTLPCWEEGARVGQREGMAYVIQSDRQLAWNERECRPAS